MVINQDKKFFVLSLCLFSFLILPFSSKAFDAEEILVTERAAQNFVLVEAEFEAFATGKARVWISYNTTFNPRSDANWQEIETIEMDELYTDLTTKEVKFNQTVCGKVQFRRFGTPIVRPTKNCKFIIKRVRKADPNDWYRRPQQFWNVWLQTL
jgi:hypothetical protein